MEKVCPRLVLIALAATWATEARAENAGVGPPCRFERQSEHTVAAVVDAETIVVEGGHEVRLVGALPPRPPLEAKADAWPPEQLVRKALEALVLSRTVTLRSAGETSDRYGRWLAHAFVETPGQAVWVEGELVSRGLARAYALPGSTACLAPLLALEREARSAGRGLWGSGEFAVRNAASTSALLARRLSFEIVEGEVARVADVGGRLYMNFGSDWRRDFTATVPRRLIADAPEAAARIKALEGKRVRVRGWIERRNGPMIELSDLGEIEVVEGKGDAAAVADRAREPAAPR